MEGVCPVSDGSVYAIKLRRTKMPKVKLSTVETGVNIMRANIEARCALLGLRTDERIAKKLCMPKSSYSDRRNNPHRWTLEQLLRVCEILKVTPQWLFTDHSGRIE